MLKEKESRQVLRRYIKEEGRSVGVVVAVSPDSIGYSICNIDSRDCFSKKIAIRRAMGRAMSQKKCDFSFWKKVISKKLSTGRYKVSTDEIEVYLELKDNESLFPFPTVSGNLRELRALKALKFMDKVAKKYTW